MPRLRKSTPRHRNKPTVTPIDDLLARYRFLDANKYGDMDFDVGNLFDYGSFLHGAFLFIISFFAVIVFLSLLVKGLTYLL